MPISDAACRDASRLKLELCAAATKTEVWVDPELTGQVVLNLLDNAIKYAPESEIVCLKVLPSIEADQQHYVALQIQDQGKGIEANRAKALRPMCYNA